MKHSPPDHTKRIKDCRLRSPDGNCCNAQNYLRPHQCNGYCVVQLDQWIRKENPDLNQDDITATVIKLTNHDS